MPNPWMSLWLSAANAWAGAARGFWTAEMRRQQTAMLNEMNRQIGALLDRRLGAAVIRREDQDEAALRCQPCDRWRS